MKQLWEVGNFVRGLRSRMRFGELSRAPLKLLRLELHGDKAECDWVARPLDPWDASMPRGMQEQHSSMQALHDALGMREMLFLAIPDVSSAELRAYRQSAREPPHLIIRGSVTREPPAGNVKRIRSLVMRAKMFGFKFWMDNGVLAPLESVDRRFGFAT
jgi:hypothetical protein